jgi:dTDP-4-amino-4,6-dideoxygalactose transaminase
MSDKAIKANNDVADFRYDTGLARIPWPAVGEPVTEDDVLEIIKFLLPPAEGKEEVYQAQVRRLQEDIGTLRSCARYAGKLTLGNHVKNLEAEVAKMLDVKYALFVTNATAGFEIAYKFAGLKPGDEVIAPSITFIATIVYPLSIGAKVVIADVDPLTLNMDPKDVARKVTRQTRVIIPVHLGGYPVDMDPIMDIAREGNITVIEDAAHAFGGGYKGKALGTIGHFGAFSFHEVKNVTSLGEGGILVTNTPFGRDFSKSRFVGLDLSRQIPNWLYEVVALESRDGWCVAGNHSVTEIQAIGLSLQLKRMAQIIAHRKQAKEYLNDRLAKVDGIITPPSDSRDIKSTHHLYCLQIDHSKVGGDIQTLKKKLTDKGVVNIPHFAPLYHFSIMRQLGYDTTAIARTCPVSEEAFQHRFTHLPLYKLSTDDLRFLADAVIAAVQETKEGR